MRYQAHQTASPLLVGEPRPVRPDEAAEVLRHAFSEAATAVRSGAR